VDFDYVHPLGAFEFMGLRANAAVSQPYGESDYIGRARQALELHTALTYHLTRATNLLTLDERVWADRLKPDRYFQVTLDFTIHGYEELRAPSLGESAVAALHSLVILQRRKTVNLIVDHRPAYLHPSVFGRLKRDCQTSSTRRYFLIGQLRELDTQELRARAIAFGRQPARTNQGSARGVTTVLFTDVVDHTELFRRLGDDRARDVMRRHDNLIRDLLNRHGGMEVKSMGDGFLALFPSPSVAVSCAIAIQNNFPVPDSTSDSVAVRIGINAGEPIEEEHDVFGAAVILASRVCARARGGQILMAEPVRHLLTGRGFLFADQGEFVPKGFEDAVKLVEVRWRR
jgi:class 3 adenylate cyclase